MTFKLSRAIIVLGLILAWLAAIWVVINILFADQDTLVGDSIAVGCAVLAPIVLMLGWVLFWLAEKQRRPLARS